MNDRLWLEKVSVALEEWKRQGGNQNAVTFVSWLYKQYGYEMRPEDKNTVKPMGVDSDWKKFQKVNNGED
jgi:hypothetical protein